MKSLLLILAASLLVAAFFRAVMRLVRANREEQRDTEPSPVPVRPAVIHIGGEVADLILASKRFGLSGLRAGTYELFYASDCGCVTVLGALIVEGDGSVQTVTLNPDLPPMDFGELPDVTEGAVESAKGFSNIAVEPTRAVPLTCKACGSRWGGCAAVCHCPACGEETEFPDPLAAFREPELSAAKVLSEPPPKGEVA